LGILSELDLGLDNFVRDVSSEHTNKICNLRVLETCLLIELAESTSELIRETDVIESQEEVAIIRNLMLIPPLWLLAVNYFDINSLSVLQVLTHFGQFSRVFGKLMFLKEIFELLDIHLVVAIVRLLYFISNSNIAISMLFSAIPLQPC
jgi:hypothetical protein